MKARLVTAFVIIGVVFSWLVSNATPAYAHATLVRTDPPDGATLVAAPRQLRLWFNEPIVFDFTQAGFSDGDGQKYIIAPLHFENDATSPSGKGVVVVVDLPELKPNAYRLSWQTRSADDLHVIASSVTFGVQHAVNSSNSENAPATSPLEVALRWLSFMSLAGLIGALALVWPVLPPASFKISEGTVLAVRRRFSRLAFWAGLAALATNLALLLLQGAEGAAWWLILTRTPYGTRWLFAQGLLGLLVGVLWWQNRTSKTSRNISFILLLAVAVVGVQSVSSHTGGALGITVLAVSIDTVHLLAANLWSGGLLMLVLVVIPLLRRGAEESTVAWSILRRFGGLAAFSLAVLVVTGLYKSGEQVASLDGLLTTPYGQALLAKIELVLLVMLIGLLNAALFHPKVAEMLRRISRRPVGWQPFWSRHLRRTILIEACGGLLILLLAAFLAASQPARGPEFDPPLTANETTTASSLSGEAADLVLNASVKPNRPGQNFLNLNVLNTRRPAPAAIDSVTIVLQAPGTNNKPITLPVESLGNNRYQVAGNYIDSTGLWNMKITVNRGGLPPAELSFSWTVLSGQENGTRRPVVFSNQPLAPLLNTIALLLGLAIMVTFLWLWFKPKTKQSRIFSFTFVTGRYQRQERKD